MSAESKVRLIRKKQVKQYALDRAKSGRTSSRGWVAASP